MSEKPNMKSETKVGTDAFFRTEDGLKAVENRGWKCDLGNGEWDHDWKEIHDSSGEVDGWPGDHWTQRECRVCGLIETARE